MKYIGCIKEDCNSFLICRFMSTIFFTLNLLTCSKNNLISDILTPAKRYSKANVIIPFTNLFVFYNNIIIPFSITISIQVYLCGSYILFQISIIQSQKNKLLHGISDPYRVYRCMANIIAYLCRQQLKESGWMS